MNNKNIIYIIIVLILGVFFIVLFYFILNGFINFRLE